MTIAPVDPELRKALAREAEGLMANPAFAIAIKTLRMQWYAEQINATTADQVLDLASRLRALDAIPQMLDHLMTSEIMAQKRESDARRH